MRRWIALRNIFNPVHTHSPSHPAANISLELAKLMAIEFNILIFSEPIQGALIKLTPSLGLLHHPQHFLFVIQSILDTHNPATILSESFIVRTRNQFL